MVPILMICKLLYPHVFFLAVQMVSAVTVGLNFDNLSMSIYYLITSWIVQPNTASVFLGN